MQRQRLALPSALLLAALLADPAPASARERMVTGFITDINPDRSAFRIWKNRFAVPPDVRVALKNNEAGLRLGIGDLRVGMHVEARGEYAASKYDLTARQITIDVEQFEEEVKRTAYLYREVEGLSRDADGRWSGTLRIDGQRIRVEPASEVGFRLNREERRLAEKQARARKSARGDDLEDEGPEPAGEVQALRSLDQVRPGDICEYLGRRDPDGTLAAQRLVFERNVREKGERRLWEKLKLTEKEASEEERKRGEIRVAGERFKTYWSRPLQDYVREVGARLVPEYQRNLAPDDPRRIDFRFYVIDGERSPNAGAFPNGILVVNTAMLLMLDNEAQLASVLGHEIAHALNEHTYRQMMFHRKKRIAIGVASLATALMGMGTVSDVLTLTSAAITNGYQRFLEDQADRYGVALMAERGYNPLQSIQVWINMTRNFGDAPSDFFWSSHSSHTERISYLLLAVRDNYPDRSSEDFERMELGAERYLGATEELRSDPRLAKLRKRMEAYRKKYDEEEGPLKF